ncbi:MAG: AAA family ATPase [Nitrolancea sp.]
MLERFPAEPKQHSSGHPLTPFVGREPELLALRNAFDLAMQGLRQVILLGGEPGIGKTSIMSRFAGEAREKGSLVLWGNCYEWEGAPAYWPWTQVLGTWLRDLDEDDRAALLGPRTNFIAQLVPEIHDRVPELTPVPGGLEARRFQLMTAVAQTMRLAAARRPLVIVLDDVHWADAPTLELLLFLSQEIRDERLVLIVGYRDADLTPVNPATPILTDLGREPHTHRLSLKGLPKPQVAHLVMLITGRAQAPGLVETVYTETNGNPFFVTEVARLIADEGSLDATHDRLPRHPRVPDSVRSAIRRRLDRLSEDCNRALTVAAVVGREFDVRILERTTGTPVLVLLDAIDEALRAGLLTSTQLPSTFRFSHALVQETIYEEIPRAERSRLHMAVGQALELEADRERLWAELAHHFFQASPLGGPENVANYSARAGDAAMAQFDWIVAASHFKHALDALDELSPVDVARQCDLLLSLGEAQNRAGSGAGDAPAARISFSRAFDIARTFGDGVRMAQAAVGYAGNNISAAFGGPRQLEMLEEALAVLDPSDSPLRVRLLARLAMDLWFRSTDNLVRSRACAEEAVAIASSLGDPTLMSFALNGRHNSGNGPDNLTERMDDADHLIDVAEQTGDPIAAAWGYILQVMDAIEAGNISDAERSVAWLQAFDERVRIPYVSQRVAVCSVMLDLLAGRYATAAVQVRRAKSLWQSSVPRQHASQSFFLLRDIGTLDSLDEDIQIPDKLHSWRLTALAHRMALALERGQVAAARADYEAIVADDFALVVFNQHWTSTLAMLAEAAVAFDDADRAKRMVVMLEPYPERQIMDGSLGVCHGPVALYLGRLAGLLAHWDDATRWLDQSLVICQRLGLRPFIARTLLAQAELLAARDGHGSLKARELSEHAIEAAESIGMLGLIPRAITVRDAPIAEPAAAFGLTPRELDVLQLIAQGLTDAEVAKRLFLSPRTVSTHLTSVYGKLNVSSRSAATRVAFEQHLV